MVPDFEYFLHLRPLALWGHSLTGLLTFCVPVGVVVLAVWESIVRAPVRALLGFPGDERSEAHGVQWWARATIALVVGSITHILWDGLTHQGGWGLRVFPLLGAVALPVAGRPLIWAGVLDYGSTLAGGFVVLAWLGGEMRRTHAVSAFAETPWRWVVTLSLCAVAVAVGLWNGSREAIAHNFRGAELMAARVAVGTMLGLGIALVMFGVAYRICRPAVRVQAI